MENPVFINCRDRLAPLIQLIAWLEKAGQDRIYLIDNDSSYPPLLEYYETTPHRVIRLGQNVGHKALWLTDSVSDLRESTPFIFTDPDIVPIDDCPVDAIEMFADVLDRHPDIKKVGFGLKIDDIPDHYRFKREVILWESQYWKEAVEPGLFRAPIDTTFALYRASGEHQLDKCIRTGHPYVARHTSWYVESDNPSDEDRYYGEHAREDITHWTRERIPDYLLKMMEELPGAGPGDTAGT